MKTPAFVLNPKTGRYQVIPDGCLRVMPNGRMGIAFADLKINEARHRFLVDYAHKFKWAQYDHEHAGDYYYLWED